MIAARIGADHFIAWRLRAAPPLPHGLEAVRDGGGPWLLFACASLQRVRLGGLAWPGRCRVAAWLVPCHLPDGGVGNLFQAAYSDAPAVIAAYRLLGMRSASLARLRVDATGISGPGVRARLGAPLAVPDLAWFAADRCGLIATRHGVRRLPLAKRGWQHRGRAVAVDCPALAGGAATAVAALDCSADLACWGMPVPLAAARSPEP